jgi:hypothetical protein
MSNDKGLGAPRSSDRRYGVFVGIVKKNDDPQRMGRCSVWIPEMGGDPDTPGNWYTVGYASPFAGASPVRDNRKDGADQDSTQTAYGFWMQPPDLDNHVLVTFANGDIAQGYWFACIFAQNMNHAVPGIPSNVSTDESLTGQGIYPPTVEYNKRSKENPDNPHRPTFEPLHNGLTNQGLYPDAERGRSSSGVRREAPSKVFGYSTPRGSGLLIDDNPENEFIRMRTRSGAQVLVHDTTGFVYINSKDGKSWAEISDEGVSIYSEKSISIRAETDINLRADRDVNIEGERGVFIRGGKAITTESGEFTHMKAGSDIKMAAAAIFQQKSGAAFNVESGATYTAKSAGDFNIESGGSYTGKSSGVLTMDSGGTMNLKAGGQMLRSASAIHDNGPGAASAPSAPSVEVPEVRKQGERINIKPPVGATQAESTTSQLSVAAAQVEQAAPKLAETATAAASAAAAVEVTVAAPEEIDDAGEVVSKPPVTTPVAELPKMYQDTITNNNQKIAAAQGLMTSYEEEMASLLPVAEGDPNYARYRQLLAAHAAATSIKDSATASNTRTQALGAKAQADSDKLSRITQQIGGGSGGSLSGALGGTTGAVGSVSGALGGVTGTVGSLTNQASGIAGRVTQMSGQLGQITAQAQGAANQLTQAASAAVGNALGAFGSALNEAKGSVGSATEALNTAISEGTNGIGGALGKATGQIGGKLGSRLTGAATSAVGSGASKLTGAVSGAVSGAVGKVTGKIDGAIGGVTGQVNNVLGKGLGAVSAAQAQLGTAMGQAQQIGSEIGKMAATAKSASADLDELAASIPGITPDSAAALTAAAAPLAEAATSVASAAAAATVAGGQGLAAASTETTIKTIVNLMPTHEPYPWHVKEGQKSPEAAASTEQERADAVASAAARPGQGTLSEETPVDDPHIEKITTGTGDVFKKASKFIGPAIKIGSKAVRGDVLSAVKEAASVGGVDVGYLMARASKMGFNPATKLSSSGATGLMQIAQGVYKGVVKKYGAELGIGVNDIRKPRANALVGAMIAKENTVYLEEHGLEPSATALSLAHTMGAPIAARFLTNLSREPSAPAFEHTAEDFVRSHRNVFYKSDGTARTLEEVYHTFDTQISGQAQFYREAIAELEVPATVPPITPDMLS